MLKVRNNRESGQALLLVLLTMAAIVTVILSVASRSVTDISVTTSEEDALRAFSAAEAGIEKALLTNTDSSGTAVPINPNDTSDTSVTYSSNIINNTIGTTFQNPSTLKSGETATFWLVSHTNNGELSCAPGLPCYEGGGSRPLKICWGDGPAEAAMAQRPAIEVSVFYDTSLSSIASPSDFSNVKVAQYGFDRYASDPSHANGFTSTGISLNTCVINGKTYLYQSPSVTQSLCGTLGCVLLAKVKMIYNSTAQSVGATVPAGTLFPSQGSRIESTGVAGTSTRKVNVFQSFAEPPNIFDVAVFSLGDFTKL